MSKKGKIWVAVEDYDRNFITGCLEAGVDGIYCEKEIGERVNQLGVVETITPDGDLVPGEDVTTVTISGKEDEEKVLAESVHRYVIVETADWMIIPLENLIAQTENLFARVDSAEDARTALETLEKGVDGVLLETNCLSEVENTVDLIKNVDVSYDLQTAVITAVEKLGLGDRVCVDTCTMMTEGEGMLVGDSSAGMFLVSAEVKQSEYVASRPFRVNAGGVHAYIRTPGDCTKYLAELQTGDEVTVIDHKGRGKPAIIGRSKLEKRPLMKVNAELETEEGKKEISLVLQNAETINLVAPGGEPVSVARLRAGDEVLAFYEEAGRHFGVKVEETIAEK